MKRSGENRTTLLREIGRVRDEKRNLDSQIQMGTFGEQLSALERYRSRINELDRMLESLQNRLLEFDKPARADVIKVGIHE